LRGRSEGRSFGAKKIDWVRRRGGRIATARDFDERELRFPLDNFGKSDDVRHSDECYFRGVFPEGLHVSLDFKPKPEKILELLLYLAYARPNADKYQAVKFFYLADKEHLTRYGRPITQERYFALPYGPVASTAMDLLERDPRTMRELKVDSLPFRVEDKATNNGRITYIREPFRAVEMSLFSKSDIRVFDEIIKRYGQFTFDELFRLTHDHYAYKRAWFSRKGARAAPMRYEDMVEEADRRTAILQDFGPVAPHMR